MTAASSAAPASSPKRFAIWASAIVLVGAVALAIAWKQFLSYAQEQRAKMPPVAEKGRFEDYGRIADFRFTNWDGKEVSRASLEDKVWVVDFIFTTCRGLCPVMSQAMQRLQTRIAETDAIDKSALRLVSVSTDPELDTPERLEAYAQRYSADPALWYFVRGPFDDVQRFSQDALKLGLDRATKQQIHEGAEKIIHSNKFVLIDARGHVRKIYAGTTPSEVDELLRDLPHLLGGKSRTDEKPAK